MPMPVMPREPHTLATAYLLNMINFTDAFVDEAKALCREYLERRSVGARSITGVTGQA